MEVYGRIWRASRHRLSSAVKTLLDLNIYDLAQISAIFKALFAYGTLQYYRRAEEFVADTSNKKIGQVSLLFVRRAP